MTDPIRLSQLAKRAGSATKQPPGYLLPLLGALPPINDPNLLVGGTTADDAAVYKLSDELALVLTNDFLTPIVDGPYDFGAIAAAHALSDVYARGGTPVAALSIVGFSEASLPPEVLVEILRGAAEKAAEAGIAIVGGQTIKTDEPIFGLSVVGKVSPDKYLANSGAKPGDVLILTKPLGLGIIAAAAKRNEDRLGAIGEAIKIMSTLNRAAGEEIVRCGANALTDVTGLGLLGHLQKIVAASKVGAKIFAERIPVLRAAREYVHAGIYPGETNANHQFLLPWVTYSSYITKPEQLLLCDAQTSGGLLASVPAERADALLAALQARGLRDVAKIGHIEATDRPKISVIR